MATLAPPAFDEATDTDAPLLPPTFDEAEDADPPLIPPSFDEAEDTTDPATDPLVAEEYPYPKSLDFPSIPQDFSGGSNALENAGRAVTGGLASGAITIAGGASKLLSDITVNTEQPDIEKYAKRIHVLSQKKSAWDDFTEDELRAMKTVPDGYRTPQEEIDLEVDKWHLKNMLGREAAGTVIRKPLLDFQKISSLAAKESQTFFGQDPNRQDEFLTKLSAGVGSLPPYIASAMAGGPVLSMMIGSMQTAQGEYDAAVAAGHPELADKAFENGLSIGLTEGVGVGGGLSKPAKGFGEKVFKWVMGGVKEGGQEWFQNTFSNLNASVAAKYDTARPILQGGGDAAMIGFILGGGVEAIGQAVQPAPSDSAEAEMQEFERRKAETLAAAETVKTVAQEAAPILPNAAAEATKLAAEVEAIAIQSQPVAVEAPAPAEIAVAGKAVAAVEPLTPTEAQPAESAMAGETIVPPASILPESAAAPLPSEAAMSSPSALPEATAVAEPASRIAEPTESQPPPKSTPAPVGSAPSRESVLSRMSADLESLADEVVAPVVQAAPAAPAIAPPIALAAPAETPAETPALRVVPHGKRFKIVNAADEAMGKKRIVRMSDGTKREIPRTYETLARANQAAKKLGRRSTFGIPPSAEGEYDIIDAILDSRLRIDLSGVSRGELANLFPHRGAWRNTITSEGSGNTPSKVAEALMPTEQKIAMGEPTFGDGDERTMFDLISQAIKSRTTFRDQGRAQAANERAFAKQARTFARDALTPQPGQEGTPVSELKLGDVVTVNGERLVVTGTDPDTGDVTLEDGKRYGVQSVEDGKTIYGELEPAAPTIGDSDVDPWADVVNLVTQEKEDAYVEQNNLIAATPASNQPIAESEQGEDADAAGQDDVAQVAPATPGPAAEVAETPLAKARRVVEQREAELVEARSEGDYELAASLARVLPKLRRDLAAAEKAETEPTPEAPAPAPEPVELWQRTRAQVGGMLAKHREAVKEAVARGKVVPDEVLAEYAGSAWADKAISKRAKAAEKAELASKPVAEQSPAMPDDTLAVSQPVNQETGSALVPSSPKDLHKAKWQPNSVVFAAYSYPDYEPLGIIQVEHDGTNKGMAAARNEAERQANDQFGSVSHSASFSGATDETGFVRNVVSPNGRIDKLGAAEGNYALGDLNAFRDDALRRILAAKEGGDIDTANRIAQEQIDDLEAKNTTTRDYIVTVKDDIKKSEAHFKKGGKASDLDPRFERDSLAKARVEYLKHLRGHLKFNESAITDREAEISKWKSLQTKQAKNVTRAADQSGKPSPSGQEAREREVLEKRLATAKAEIEQDIKDGTVPNTVKSFEELADYVDANEYVNDAERPDRLIGPLGKSLGWKAPEYVAFTNRLIEAVDAWLKSRSAPKPKSFRELMDENEAKQKADDAAITKARTEGTEKYTPAIRLPSGKIVKSKAANEGHGELAALYPELKIERGFFNNQTGKFLNALEVAREADSPDAPITKTGEDALPIEDSTVNTGKTANVTNEEAGTLVRVGGQVVAKLNQNKAGEFVPELNESGAKLTAEQKSAVDQAAKDYTATWRAAKVREGSAKPLAAADLTTQLDMLEEGRSETPLFETPRAKIDQEIDSHLSASDRAAAAAELGDKTWTDRTAKAFREAYADWLVTAKSASDKLTEIFRRVLAASRAGLLSISVAVSFNPKVAERGPDIPAVKVAAEQRAVSLPELPRFSPPAPGARPLSASARLASLPPPSFTLPTAGPIKASPRPPADFGNETASADVRNMADWIMERGDNEGRSFAVADKTFGAIYLFDGSGKLASKAPALFGKEIGDEEFTDSRTTPAGRFDTSLGVDPEGHLGRTVDFHGSLSGGTVAIHRLYLEDPSERRPQRLKSADPKDNRVSYGCINVDGKLMDDVILPLFEGGGTVYVLPETGSGKAAFEEVKQDRILNALQKARESLRDRPGELLADPLLIKTFGKPVLRTALDIVIVAYRGGKALVEAIELGVAHLRQWAAENNKDFDEDMARGMFAPYLEAEKSAETSGAQEPPPELPKGSAERPAMPETTAAYNAETDKLLEAGGFEPIAGPASKALGESWDAAKAQAEADPGKGSRLVEELIANPRTLVDDVESGVLLHELAKRKAEQASAQSALFKAVESGDETAIGDARTRLEDARTATYEAITAAKLTGTAWGRAGRFRQVHVDQDFSLVAMEAAWRGEANSGKPLTPDQYKLIADLHAKIAASEAKVAAFEAKEAEADAKRVFEQVLKEAKKEASAAKANGNRVATFLHQQAAKARERIIARRGKLFATVDPLNIAGLVDEAIIGADHIANGLTKLADWSAAMLKDFGDRLQPVMPALFEKAKEYHATVSTELGKGKSPLAPDAVLANSKAGALDPKLVFDLARAHVNAGVVGMENVMKAVHSDLLPLHEGLTEREVRDAFSGYGKTSFPSREADLTALREYKTLARLTSQLEDAQRKLAPLKTGPQRDKASQAVRDLTKQVKEAMRRLGIETTTPEQQLKTSLDAVKTRLKNQIEDLEKQIATRTKPEGKTPIPYDDEATALRTERDRLANIVEEIFGKPELTDAQRIAIATKSLDRSIAEEDALLKAGILKRPTRGSKTRLTPELEEKRALLDSMRALRKELAEAGNPKRTPEQIQLARDKKLIEKRTAELRRRVAANDYAPRPKKDPVMDAEKTKLLFENAKAKEAYLRGKFEEIQRQRSLGRKIFDAGTEGLNLSRAVLTSADLSAPGRQGGFIALAHPIRAARSFIPMLKAFASEKAAFKVKEEIKNRPNAPIYAQAKLFLSDQNAVSLTAMEEAFMSRIATKLPIVAGSQRAYSTFLDKLRADSFDAMAKTLGGGASLTPVEARAIANFINVATGRGSIPGAAAQAAAGLNSVFFAPRYVLSRFQLLVGQPLWSGNARTRALVASEYARYLIGVGVVVALAIKAQDDDDPDIELDPTSTNFLKIRFGNSRLDPFSGLLQASVFSAREGKALQRFATKDESKQPKYGSGGDVLGRFLRSKLSPAFGTAVDVVSGKDVTGQNVTPLSAAQRMVTPLSPNDILKVMKEQDVPEGVALSILSFLGFGVQTYEEKRSRK